MVRIESGDDHEDIELMENKLLGTDNLKKKIPSLYSFGDGIIY